MEQHITYIVFGIGVAIGPFRCFSSVVGKRCLGAVGGDFDGEGATSWAGYRRNVAKNGRNEN